jgi:hypothetical protein
VLSITAVLGVLAALAVGLIRSRLRHRPRETIWVPPSPPV